MNIIYKNIHKLFILLATFFYFMPAYADFINDPNIDVKVGTNNNAIVDGGNMSMPATPGIDGQNRTQNEPSIAISPVDPNIIAITTNDYRLEDDDGPLFVGDVWEGLYISTDGGETFFNTLIPGFPGDQSGFATEINNAGRAGDPSVRFDAEGNLYASVCRVCKPKVVTLFCFCIRVQLLHLVVYLLKDILGLFL